MSADASGFVWSPTEVVLTVFETIYGVELFMPKAFIGCGTYQTPRCVMPSYVFRKSSRERWGAIPAKGGIRRIA